jgi:hypothetical protein
MVGKVEQRRKLQLPAVNDHLQPHVGEGPGAREMWRGLNMLIAVPAACLLNLACLHLQKLHVGGQPYHLSAHIQTLPGEAVAAARTHVALCSWKLDGTVTGNYITVQ